MQIDMLQIHVNNLKEDRNSFGMQQTNRCTNE